MSVVVNIVRTDNKVRYDDHIVKQIIFPMDHMTTDEHALDDARTLGEDILEWIEEFDGENIDIVIEVRPDPLFQRTMKDGRLR